jgi:hypothetical protein
MTEVSLHLFIVFPADSKIGDAPYKHIIYSHTLIQCYMSCFYCCISLVLFRSFE